jgi:hypothetical protein
VKVSTLVVTNRPQFLEWWTWNIRKQTYRPDEVVVVTNTREPYPNTDEIDELLGRYGELKHVLLAPTVTIGEMRQQALDIATGDIITWFDDDDWQWSENIERLVMPILRHPDRCWMHIYPFSHKLATATALVYPVEGAEEPWLPSTATRARIAKLCHFRRASQAEDVYWIEAARELVGTHLRWDFTGKPPAMNVLLVMHGKNVYSEEWRQHYKGAPRPSPLSRYPQPNVSREEWAETLAMLKKTFGVEPPDEARTPREPTGV